MPTYEYICENEHEFEEFQSMLDPAIGVCPVCGGRAERRISGGSGLIFKGSGFYITDYVKNKGGTSSESSSTSARTSADSTKSSTETKSSEAKS
jgi:putative FmdB family regulatory protein